jgi:hypothetical protein
MAGFQAFEVPSFHCSLETFANSKVKVRKRIECNAEILTILPQHRRIALARNELQIM